MRVAEYVALVRPNQWLKNLMLFFPPFLGGVVVDHAVAVAGLLAFASFCSAAGTVYIVNDIIDREHDILHPVKKYRPIASGRISAGPALIVAVCCFVLAIFASLLVSPPFSLYVALYVVISLAYSLWLKNVPILDLVCISGGFLVRLEAGGEAFSVPISAWLFCSVLFLAIYLSAGKRLAERNLLGKAAKYHRQSLCRYPKGLLETLLYISGSASLVTYTLYSMAKNQLYYTIPVCIFGLLRYLFRVKSGLSGDPTDSLLKDAPLFVTGALWAIMVGWSIYR